MPAKTNELVLAISTHRGHRGMLKQGLFSVNAEILAPARLCQKPAR